MSTTRIHPDVPFHAPQLVSVLNTQAERIDEMAARLDSQAQRLAKLELRAAAPQPIWTKGFQSKREEAEASASKPDPKSWGERMRAEIGAQRRACRADEYVSLDEESKLIAEAEAAMKPEWRPMDTAPRDGRWVLLRIRWSGGDNPAVVDRQPSVVRRWSDVSNGWSENTGYSFRTDMYRGWLPIPGEGDA